MSVNRILHCPIGNMNIGGIENVLMQLYRNIDREKIQFDFVVHDYSENYFENEIKYLGGKIYRVPFISKNPFKHFKEFDTLLKEHPEYKIIHIHTTYSIMYFDAKIARDNGRKVIIHSHNSNATRFHTLIHVLLKKKISRIADYRLACSYIAGDWMFNKSYSYEIWKNSINLSKFNFDGNKRKFIREKYRIEDDMYLIGNVARLSYQKNQELLIRIFYKYLKRNSKSVLMLVGDGEDREKLQELVLQLGIRDKVIFVGNVNNVEDYLMAMDLFCLTSRWEGFGVSIIEAYTAGLQAVVTDVVDKLIKELDIVKTVGHNGSIDDWVDVIDNTSLISEVERGKYYKKASSLGYGIETQALEVTNFYSEIIKKDLIIEGEK